MIEVKTSSVFLASFNCTLQNRFCNACSAV